MPDKREILIASDLSARCDRALDRAFLLTQQLDASLTLLHVVEESAPFHSSVRERLAELVRQDLGERYEEVTLLLRQGSAPTEIAEVAAERECSLVVTGVARFNSPVDYMLGTAVDHIVRHASVPVLIVKRRPHRPYSRLLVATDFSECSRTALREATMLFPQASFRVTHVYHAAFEGFLDRDESAAFVASQADEEMKAFVANSRLSDPLLRHLDTSLELGELPPSLMFDLRMWGGDLLVLGSHGRGGFAHATIGSQAADILNYADADVLVVPSRCGSSSSS